MLIQRTESCYGAILTILTDRGRPALLCGTETISCFVSSAYSGGSRVIRLEKRGDKTTATEVWSHKKMRVHHSNVIRVADYVYGSNGDFGPTPFTAVNVKTGEISWRDRSFGKANTLLLGKQGNGSRRGWPVGGGYIGAPETGRALKMQSAEQQSMDSARRCRIQALRQGPEGDRGVRSAIIETDIMPLHPR